MRANHELLRAKWVGQPVPSPGACTNSTHAVPAWCALHRHGAKLVVVPPESDGPLLLKAGDPLAVRAESDILNAIASSANGTSASGFVLWTSTPFEVRMPDGRMAPAVLQQRVLGTDLGSVLFSRHSGMSYRMLAGLPKSQLAVVSAALLSWSEALGHIGKGIGELTWLISQLN